MPGKIEPYLEQSLREVVLIAMAQCRAPYAFPSDHASLASLVERVNRVRDTEESLPVLGGAPSCSLRRSSDQSSIWLSLRKDGSFYVTAFQGTDQTRVMAVVDENGHLGEFVVNPAGAGTTSVDDDRSMRFVAGDEDAEPIDRARDVLFRTALIVMANRASEFASESHFDDVGKATQDALGIQVFVARQGDEEIRPLSWPNGVGEMVEIGPADGRRTQLRARVQDKQCSAWITSSGRLEEVGTEMVVGADPDVRA